MQLRALGSFGAEADRIPDDFAEVRRAFFEAEVLVFRNQELTADRFLAFARQFGRPEPHVIDQFHHLEHADIRGGDTLFADQYAAYDDLPSSFKKRIVSKSSRLP